MLHWAWSKSDHKYPSGFKAESAHCPAVTLLSAFPSHSPNTVRLSLLHRSWFIQLFMNSIHQIVSIFPFSVRSPFYFLCSFFLASAPLLFTLSPSFSPCSLSSFLLSFLFLSFHSYLTHFLPHPTLSNNIAFPHFGIINVFLAFFFAFSLLSLSFSLS